MSAVAFRSDINGLRAWAVLAVIFYHFAIPPFNGGFVGVDVFFVISGFLMTSIICRGLFSEHSQFSLSQFYLSRIRRITPALTFLSAALLFSGACYLTAIDFKTLGLHVLASLMFISNIVYWLESGYFDVDSHEKWLLHTWSLSVEWQFYILLPLFLLLLWKIKPTKLSLQIGIISLFIASLCLSIKVTPLNASAAFYWLPTRAWEMLAGGLVYLYWPTGITNNRYKKILSVLGFLFITVSILLFTPQTLWPGYFALLPVIGSMLVIIANANSVFVRLPILQWIGTRSYSLYLWHWPVVVALVYVQRQDQPLMIVLGLVITLILSQLSFILIESPSRTALVNHKLKAALVFLLPLLLITVIGAWVFQQQGFSARLPANVTRIEDEQLNKNPRYQECHITTGKQFKACKYGSGALQAIVVGDSHADALVTAVSTALDKGSVMELSYGGCPTVKGIILNNIGNNYCDVFNDWAFTTIKSLPNNAPVIIINRASAAVFGSQDHNGNSKNSAPVHFSNAPQLTREQFLQRYQNDLVTTACDYAKYHTVYLLKPIPEMLVNVPRIYSRSAMRGAKTTTETIAITKNSYKERNAFIIKAQNAAVEKCHVKLLDPTPYLCDSQLCYGTKNEMPLYYDDNHLSETGNRLLVPMFKILYQGS